MNIIEINEQWAEDSKMSDDMFEEGKKLPRLHQKYFGILLESWARLSKEKSDLKELIRDKTEYYSGVMDPLEIKKRGWPPLSLKILKADVSTYVEADKDVIQKSIRIGIASDKVKYLEDIIKMIHSRGYTIKTMTDWAKFQHGA